MVDPLFFACFGLVDPNPKLDWLLFMMKLLLLDFAFVVAGGTGFLFDPSPKLPLFGFFFVES